ncbi:hypothetical protein A2160_02265 [Candidatus Beckwithbacteria bacterium RBG_13_42_9]|uniref:Uncharacterized protein n=1 Tax=Candidatus Beckwithbacteria bacterium RBG_13_42_9 TaxID=1797457 RepID=A0A1F5E7F7_9BACT|nr:MAG: hypothetical protein A2160_02265 [Candidatus Beckwithbacteria bacterium RBG_13_42_9]
MAEKILILDPNEGRTIVLGGRATLEYGASVVTTVSNEAAIDAMRTEKGLTYGVFAWHLEAEVTSRAAVMAAQEVGLPIVVLNPNPDAQILIELKEKLGIYVIGRVDRRVDLIGLPLVRLIGQ